LFSYNSTGNKSYKFLTIFKKRRGEMNILKKVILLGCVVMLMPSCAVFKQKEVVEEIILIGKVTFWTRLEPVYSKLHRLK